LEDANGNVELRNRIDSCDPNAILTATCVAEMDRVKASVILPDMGSKKLSIVVGFAGILTHSSSGFSVLLLMKVT
jgi:hypothetical protein